MILLPSILIGDAISYTVRFEGLDDPRAIKALKSYSQLVLLHSKPPATLSALRLRAESDIPTLTKVLRAYGYYEAEVHLHIQDDTQHSGTVVMTIEPGPLYTLSYFHTHSTIVEDEDVTGQAAVFNDILDIEGRTIALFSERGYPLAAVAKRSIVADGATKTVAVDLDVEPGPLLFFGETTITGSCSVQNAYIEQKIQWEKGDVYNSELVNCTQKALMDSGLFSSVSITFDPLPDTTEAPMKIEVVEAKHRSISAGASYQTTFGFGVTFGWEHRNMGGMGRRLSIQADVAQRSHSGILTYFIPDFKKPCQDLTFQGQALQTDITAYRAQSYDLLTRFDWHRIKQLYLSATVKAEYLIVDSSVDNGNFMLFEIPLHLRTSNVCDWLNPVRGATFSWKMVPSLNLKEPKSFYNWNMLTLCTYFPLNTAEWLVIAQKISYGTIWAADLDSIPVPKRFLGGSEEDLRGYKYLTVSPLDHHDRPIGGRSAFYYTLEPRFTYRSFGIVPFFDLGNVRLSRWSPFNGKWRKSVGMGFRYFSMVGPLRFDLAFPLDRREIDPHWWVFVSLGQTF